jgi:ligand-binding SRPBCC domain-containing protein
LVKRFTTAKTDKFIIHDHYFEQREGQVIMTDVFYFQSPLGVIGQLFDKLVLTEYLKKFLTERNNLIKEYAETAKWKSIVNSSSTLTVS